MIKLSIEVEEKEPQKINVSMKKLGKKEFDKSTENERIAAVEIKNAIDLALKQLTEVKENN